MNKQNVSTCQKVMLPLRLPPDLYKKLRGKVNKTKEEKRGYSINEYLTELIMQDLEKF